MQHQLMPTAHPAPLFIKIPPTVRERWSCYLVRPATRADLAFLAWVMQESARSHMPAGIWDQVFPGAEAPRLQWLEKILCLEPLHFCHYSLFLIAEDHGEPLSAISLYDPNLHGLEAFTPILIEHLRKEGWQNADLFRLIVAFAPYHSCMPKVMPGAAVCEWGATKRQHRTKGLLFLLFEHLIVRAKLQGYDYLQASHYIGNTVAQRTLQRMNFSFHDEATSPRFFEQYGCPGMARYLLPC